MSTAPEITRRAFSPISRRKCPGDSTWSFTGELHAQGSCLWLPRSFLLSYRHLVWRISMLSSFLVRVRQQSLVMYECMLWCLFASNGLELRIEQSRFPLQQYIASSRLGSELSAQMLAALRFTQHSSKLPYRQGSVSAARISPIAP